MPRQPTKLTASAGNLSFSARSERRMLKVFMKAADALDAKHGKSKAAAHKQLRKEGVVTKSGKLTKRFGG